MTSDAEKLVVVGRISGLYGVRGWVKIYSYTEPRDNILNYDPWRLGHDGQWRIERMENGRLQGRGVVAQLVGYVDRDSAAKLVGLEIAVPRDQLPSANEGEFYWTDLEGLRVRTRDGLELGNIDHLLATGANDVMVVIGDRERLIPFVMDQVVTQVHLDEGWIEVDWDPDY